MLSNEAARRLALTQYEVLFKGDRAFDRITALVARLFNVPVSVIGLVDVDCIRFPSRYGLETVKIGFAPEFPVPAITWNAPHIVENTQADASALTKMLAAEVPGMAFYAGAPLIMIDGFNLGVLWIIDQKPRVLNGKEIASLQDLAYLIVDRLESSLNSTRVLAELIRNKAGARKTSLDQSETISNMSHELRTPLNTMLGFAQLMEMENPPPTSSQKTRIKHILESGWYLLSVIDQILYSAAIESGELSLIQTPISLSKILQECQTMIKSQAQKKSITLAFPQYERSIYVMADEIKLKQVLINLLSNAIKYNREAGNVTVEYSQNDSGKIRISIHDTGVGLTQNQIDKLFQPFNRLGRETGSEEGTGIGLVVTKKLVEFMRGEIGIESVAGVGSTFWVELPAAEPRHKSNQR